MSNIRDPGERLLTRAEVAKIFQVSPSTITRWAEAGKLPVVKTLGGHRRYEAEAVMKLARHLTIALSPRTDANLNKEETNMENITLTVPAMYGDHHVLEVRRILLALPGVEEVNASSCFQTVEVSYDLTKISTDEIIAKLDKAGYLEELSVPAETGAAVTQEADSNRKTFFRHTTAFEQAKNVVGFTQEVNNTGRALWSCPGLGLIKEAEFEALEKEAIHG